MAKAPFIGGFNAEYDSQSANERSINLMPEKIDGKSQWRLRATPGLRLFTTLPFVSRGEYEASNGRVFVASNDTIYEMLADGDLIVIGLIGVGSSRVAMDDNGRQLVIVDGVSGYVYTFADSSFQEIVSDGFFPSINVVVCDGYAIMFKRNDSGVFFHSDLYNALVYDPTDEGTVESNPDKIQQILLDSTGVLMFGLKSLETYWDTGQANQVFQRRQGSVLRYGTVAPWSVASLDDGAIWVSRDQNGQGAILRLAGAQPVKLSNIAVDEAIQTLPEIVNATASTHQLSGHANYCLNIPGLDTTFVHDLSTGFWHERRSFDANGEWKRWRVERSIMGFGLNLGFDYESGKVYIIDGDYMWDDTTMRRFEREMTPIYDTNMYNAAEYNQFRLDANVGNGQINPPFDDPQISLYCSDDGGKNFGSARSKPIGRAGQYKTDLTWTRLGTTNNRVFKVAIAGPYPLSINNAFVDAKLTTQ